MLKQEVLGEKLMKTLKAGLAQCLVNGGCTCTPEEGNADFTSNSEDWLGEIEADANAG